jgi:hypothetical protein
MAVFALFWLGLGWPIQRAVFIGLGITFALAGTVQPWWLWWRPDRLPIGPELPDGLTRALCVVIGIAAIAASFL